MPSLVSAALPALLFAAATAAASAPAKAPVPFRKVLEDSPGRLVLEFNIPAPALTEVGATPGVKVSCPPCLEPGRPGAPDLPVTRFDVLSGPNAPTATFRILESETRSVPGGIAPYPQTPTPSTFVYRVDAEAYRQAAGLTVRPLAMRSLRGTPVRGLEVPLTLWSEASKTLTVIRRMQVQLDFPGVLARPSSRILTGTFRAEVLNPSGGAYLYASPASHPRSLAKASAVKSTLGERFIKIKIGDKSVESFDEDRVYAVSFGELSKAAAGGELSGVKIANLRLFTGPNDTLTRRIDSNEAVSGNLREVPIEVVDKNGNGTFDGDDSVRFFGHGTSLWKRLANPATSVKYEFSSDLYSFENYYFLDFTGSEAGQRLSDAPARAAAGAPLTNAYTYLRAEKDLAAAACDASGHKDDEVGYDWFWYWKGQCEGSSDTEVTLSKTNLASGETATLPGLVRNGAGDSLFVGFYTYLPRAAPVFTASFGGSGDTLTQLPNIGSPGTWMAWTDAVPSAPAFPLDNLRWRGLENRFEGYSVCYRRGLSLSGNPLWIFPGELGKAVSYKVQGGEGATCLRIENGVATRRIPVDGQGVFTDSLAADADVRYYVFRNTASLAAQAMEIDGVAGKGSALHDLATGDREPNGSAGDYPEYLIVTAKPLLEQALALRDYRNSPKRALQLKTEVVLVEDIYRQFSGGRLSVPAIRDFLRYAYNGWGNKSAFGRLKYVVLFGDGNYDFRNIESSQLKSPPPNLIPPYEFIVEGDRGEGSASDDFYAILDNGIYGFPGGMLDVAIGRVPVQTADEAANFLKKVADFENPALAGDWRGRAIMAADDNTQRGQPDGTDIDPISQGHTTSSDKIGAQIIENEKGVTLDKVYLLDYAMNSAYHKPEAAQDLINLINRGALMVNYVGHGASNQWADEVLLQTNDALSRMHNEGRTLMVNAFSCTVGRFESVRSEGMSEQFVKQKGVGAIAAVSATRESFPDANIALAKAFYSRLFPEDSSGLTATAGDALRDAKNSSETNSYQNDSKYQLLGEPVLLLRKPPLGVVLTQAMDTIQALDCSTIKGRITGGSGTGKVNIKILAGSVHKDYATKSDSQHVDKRGNILFERTFPYKDGVFATDYFIPKQISFGDSTAQVQVFAWDDNLEMEGTTAKQNLSIKGTSQSACATVSDRDGPRIRVTGCVPKETSDLDFPDHVKLPLPYCLQIYVQDSLGGVLSSEGPDEGTTLEIPGVLDPFHPLPGLDDLYLKSYQFSLDGKTVRPGPHLLKVSAQDGYGNISQRQIQMDLTLDSSITAVTAYNFPNPMKRNGTTFHFATVLPSADLEYGDPNAGKDRLAYDIKVYNQSGNLVRVFQNAVSGETNWDGRDNWGNLLANGVYFYLVTARQILTDLSARPDYRTVSSKRNILVISR